jgi:Pyruvate/2-oxoacid:ferredoxin oxidoreductase gamma subunit
LTGVVSREALEKAVVARAPKGTEEINRKALETGIALAEQLLPVMAPETQTSPNASIRYF